MTLLFVQIDLIVPQLKLMHNALFADQRRDDFKEPKRETQTISEKLESQMTSGEEGYRSKMYIAILLDLQNRLSISKSEIK